MAGIKRNLEGDPIIAEKETYSSPFLPMFTKFRDELDEHHDRRERIIKASRDVTASSKKMSHIYPSKDDRVRTIPAPLPPSISKDISKHNTVIQINLENISKDLISPNDHRYARQVSGGMQELIEALSFSHYLQHQKLATLEELQSLLPPGIHLSNDDYLLGLCDLVGEMMRIAITCMATQGELPGRVPTRVEDVTTYDSATHSILEDMQEIRVCFEKLDADGDLGREIHKKMDVLQTCVEKVETAAYSMIIRGRERPKGWIPLTTKDFGDTEGVTS